jgi:hypothetical protein
VGPYRGEVLASSGGPAKDRVPQPIVLEADEEEDVAQLPPEDLDEASEDEEDAYAFALGTTASLTKREEEG